MTLDQSQASSGAHSTNIRSSSESPSPEPKKSEPHILDQAPSNLRRRKLMGAGFATSFSVVTYGLLVLLTYLIGDVFADGLKWLDLDFLNNFASRRPSRAGISAALWGTVWLVVLTGLFAIPLGVSAGIYLEELMEESKSKEFISINIQNLAGVPSIVYGILGLTLFVRFMSLDRSILAGALTLSLLVLPIIIIATRESLRAIPQSIRHAALALGATRWQTVRAHILPAAVPGILTGVILAISRAVGETAPLIIVGAVAYIRNNPSSVMDAYTALAIQIYNWVGKPKEEFHELAAAGIIVLLVVMIGANLTAITIRNLKQRSNI